MLLKLSLWRIVTRYISVAVGLYYVGAALSTVGLLAGYKFAKYTWHMHDFIIGHVLFVILFLLSALQFPSTIQVCNQSCPDRLLFDSLSVQVYKVCHAR